MITLALAARDLVRSTYYLSVTDDYQQKVKEMEAIILGAAKTCGIFCTFSSLYAAYFLVERPELQVILTGLTVCMYPVAALDIIGSAAGIYGILKAGMWYRLHGENRKPFEKIAELAQAQAKSEGYRFYNRWNAYLWKAPAPSETMKRVEEIGLELIDKFYDLEFRAQLAASVNESWGYLKSGLSLLGISALSTIVCVNLPENPFWLDRKMVDFSKWLAPKIL